MDAVQLRRHALVPAVALVLCACHSSDPEAVTASERAAAAEAVESVWAGMMVAGRALNPDGIRAAYVDQPVVAINGQIIEHYDRDLFDGVRQWMRSLRRFDGSYDHVHLDVIGPHTVVTTMNHHLRWTDSTGTQGEFNSAWTAVFRRIDGRWKIAYTHESRATPE